MVYTMAYNGMNLANEFWRHSFQPIKMDTLKCYFINKLNKLQKSEEIW